MTLCQMPSIRRIQRAAQKSLQLRQEQQDQAPTTGQSETAWQAFEKLV
jgi:hypothetical protein